MQVLLAVVEDLYTFAVSMLFPWRSDLKNIPIPLYLPASRVLSPIREHIDLDVYRDTESATQEENVYEISQDLPKTENVLPQKNTIVYCTRAHVLLRTTPDDAADTAIATLAYGEMVMLLEGGAEYSYVAVGNKKGYVPTAVLAQEAASVYPEFVIGAENNSHDTTTVRLRLLIHDEFGAGLTQMPLQAHEYVYYKLLRHGAKIAWPDIRPRTPGNWAKILSTLESVAVHDTPTVGSVMEFTLPEGKAHLAYVEKVFPDQTIQISEADWSDCGIYNERIIVEDAWRTLNPEFITIAQKTTEMNLKELKKKSNHDRAAGIVLRDDELLAMFRRKDGREYYTFPGGTVEEGESPEEAVVREIDEETTLVVDIADLLYELHREGEIPRELFYRCTYRSGTPTLRSDSIEQKIQDREKNYFEPKWIHISDLTSESKNIPLLPAEVAQRLFHDLEHGFQAQTLIVKGEPIV